MADDLLAAGDLIADALDLSGTEISNILDAAPLVAALPFVPSSNGTTHKYITETAHPAVAFRAINAGKELKSSTDVAVTANLHYLDFSFAVDKAFADAWRAGGPEVLIGREGRRNLRSALMTLEAQIINTTDGAAIPGLKTNAAVNALADPMVVNAGGTTDAVASSVYLLNVGDMVGVAGVYKGDGPSVSLGETIVQDMYLAANSHMSAYYTPAGLWVGLQYGGAYSVSRIVNLTTDATKGLTDDLIAEAISRHPIAQRPTHMVMSRRSLKQLQDSRTATTATGTPAPFPQESFGVQIIVSDAIVNTETLVA